MCFDRHVLEMKQDGVDLAKINMTLLRKIEELTLYTNSQEERLRRLENRTGVFE